MRATELLIADAIACVRVLHGAEDGCGERSDREGQPGTEHEHRREDRLPIRRSGFDAAEQQHRAGDHQRSDAHLQARADALRERARSRREQQHDHGEREERRAGFESRVAEVGLQVHDHQEGGGAERGVHGEGHCVGPRELAGAEERKRHDRIHDPRFEDDEGDQREHAEAAEHRRQCGPPSARTFDQRVDNPGEAEREQGAPREVEWVLAGAFVATLGHVTGRDPDRRSRDGKVDEEHEPPRDGVDQPPAEERSDRGGHAPEPRPRSDGAAPVGGIERRRHDRQAVGNDQGGRRALDAARGDQRTRVRCDRAHHGRDREGAQPDHEDPASAVAVTERTAQHEQRAEREEVAGQHPLQIAQIGMEVARDRRQGRVDHGAVEERDARAQHRCRHDPAAGRGAHPQPGRPVRDCRTGRCTHVSSSPRNSRRL